MTIPMLHSVQKLSLGLFGHNDTPIGHIELQHILTFVLLFQFFDPLLQLLIRKILHQRKKSVPDGIIP